jgi:flavodoxin/Fe-S-cluster-containing hydrogenase component 2
MNLLNSLMGRRKFFAASLASILSILFGKTLRVSGADPLKGAVKDSSVGKRLKGCVVYYSATGSTGKIAGAIHRGMKSVMDCDIAPLKKIDPGKMDKYDVIAIGGPIWYYRETANLRLFIYKMSMMTGKPFILFCTHGTQPSGFYNSLMQPLRKKEVAVIGWKDWYGSASHVLHMPSPYVTDGHPDDIDLREAEVFGKEMAERAKRICAGEKSLIPETPSGPDADPLWQKGGMMVEGGTPSGGPSPGGPGAAAGGPGGMFASADEIPKFDMLKCVYPRCTACMDNCVGGAIDFSRTASAGLLSGSSILVEGCIHCQQPMCERACAYDAITYKQMKTKHAYDMKKCTYPKCALCVDNCPMNSIDLSHGQSIVHNNCEGCDLCWCVCPYDAISIPNIAESHALLANSETTWDSPFLANLNNAEKTGRFRRLVPVDKVGWGNIVYKNTHAPRVVLNPENYPYEVRGKV